jgi:ferritin-like protein
MVSQAGTTNSCKHQLIMEDVKAIVKQVVKIWRLYKNQQLVLTAAMREEIPFHLRTLLSRDYMICSLLKKEMANLYDGLRCCMGDRSRPESDTYITADPERDISKILEKIAMAHRQIIAEYETLLDLADGSNINTKIIHQHRKQMNTMTDELVIQSEKVLSEPKEHGYIAV